jgi:hypothetical protein
VASGLVLAPMAAPANAAGADAPPETPSVQPDQNASAETANPSPLPPSPPPVAAPELSIAEPLDGAFISSGGTAVSGEGSAGHHLQIKIGQAATPLCQTVVDAGNTWSCDRIDLPDGPDLPLRVVDEEDGSADSISVDVLGPPELDAASAGSVLTNGPVHGTAYPGATVTIAYAGQVVTTSVDGAGRWSRVLSAEDGSYDVSVSQTGPSPFPSQSSDSTRATVTFDTSAPSAPTMSVTPKNGTVQPGATLTFGGRGESGAVVTVWAATPAGSTRLCGADVTAGSWSCSGRLTTVGAYSVVALQQDRAGNTGPGSPAVAVSVAAAGTSSSTPSPSHSEQRSPSQSPSATASPHTTPSGPGAASPSPAAPAPDGGRPPMDPPDYTPFTASVQPAIGGASITGWLIAAGCALAALLLFVLPARLLAATVGGRPRVRASLFGRNRPRAETAEPPSPAAPAPWMAGALAVLIATMVAMFASPVRVDAAYLRLIPAIVLAVVAVCVVSVGVPWLFARRMPGVHVSASVAPSLLVAACVASVVSRLLGLQPALLFGAVIAVTVVAATARARAVAALAQAGGLLVLGGVAWALVGLIPAADTEIAAFASEGLGALVMLSFGSAAVLLLPFGALPGRQVLAWSRPWWFAATLVTDTVLFAAIVPAQRAEAMTAGAALFVIGIVAFAAVSLALWLWKRYIAPQLG